jgi:hypothetical protein
VGDVRQTEMHTAKPFVPEVEVAIGKFKSYKSSNVDQIPAELIQIRGKTLCLEIHILIRLIWNKEELPHQRKESTVIPIHKSIKELTIVIIKAYHCCQLHTKFYPTFFSLG